MRRAYCYLVFAALVAILSPSAGRAEASAPYGEPIVQTPAIRIVDQVDDSKVVTLKGNVHPLASARHDRGRVSADLPMTDLILVLSRDAEQQAAFDRFVASQYERDSPHFHQWLTPEQVGADFGPSESDIATVSNWLTGHGFSIADVSKDRMSIRFNGTAGQVESAFHTEIHNLDVKGEQHIGNMTDPAIPAALAPVVVGVKSLHNFFPRPQHRVGRTVARDKATGKWSRQVSTSTVTAPPTRVRPQFGVSVPASGSDSAYRVEDVTPYDFATIYNLLPLWTASTPIDGTGETIAIAGTSNITLSDVTTFRSTFGLPAYTSSNQPKSVSGNSQPLTVCTSSSGLCTTSDLIENTLDVEWAGSIAKGAQIVLVASYPASSSDDNLYDSESYIVNNKTASIMNVSYGECELGAGVAGNVQYYNLWQTAATEGIAVFVSAGDGGAAECDDGQDQSAGNPYSAQYGLAVNALASTPFNTAVGGTDFNWCAPGSTTECTASPYWNSTNATNGSSAKGYVPEVPWNDTCANPLTVPLLAAWAATINVSGVTDPESACNFVYNNWQTIQTNSGANLSYYVDTVGGGGGGSGCIVYGTTCDTSTTTTGPSNGSITLASDGWPKPSWQTGVTGIPTDGVRDLPDVSFFAADGFVSSSAYLICVSDIATCTYSTTTEPLELEVGGTSVSSPAMAGVMALINQKAGSSQGSPNTELYTLAAAETYSSCAAETGVTTNSCLFNDIDKDTNAVPCANGADEGTSTTPETSPNCTAATSGDKIGILNGYTAAAGYDQATGLGSLNVANVVNGWTATTPSTGTSAATVTETPAQTSISASDALTVAVTVAAGTSGGTTPTGTVTLSGGGYTSSATTLASGAASIDIPANSLSAGSDTLTVAYSGDTTYAASTATSTVTVTAASGTGTGMATVTVTPAKTTIATTETLSVAVAVAAGTSGGAAPTGTVTLTGGGYTSAATTLASGAATIAIPASSLTAGTDTLTVTYSGDSTYATATGTASVTVTAAASTGTFTLAAGAAAAVSAGTASSSTITVTATGGYAGTAPIACALTASPSGAVDAPTCTLSPTSVTLSSDSTTGTVTASIATTAATGTTTTDVRKRTRASNGKGWLGAGGGALAFLLFFMVPARRRSWRSMLGALALMAALGGLSACGDFWEAPTGNTANGTTSGTYTFTLTGTGAPTVTAVTTTFTLTVN
jgi:hypothetical protein